MRIACSENTLHIDSGRKRYSGRISDFIHKMMKRNLEVIPLYDDTNCFDACCNEWLQSILSLELNQGVVYQIHLLVNHESLVTIHQSLPKMKSILP